MICPVRAPPLRLRCWYHWRFLAIRQDQQEFADADDAVHVGAVRFRQLLRGQEDAQRGGGTHLRELDAYCPRRGVLQLPDRLPAGFAADLDLEVLLERNDGAV